MVGVNVAPTHWFVRAAILALVVMGPSRESQAGTAIVSAQLDYAAAPGCPTSDAFEAIVSGRLGYGPFRADAPDRVIVRIEPTGRAIEGQLEWKDATGKSIGEQLFPSRTGDCAELARAMGFALALEIQLMAASAGEDRSPSTGQPPTGIVPASAPPPPPPIVPAPAAQIQSAGSGAEDTNAHPGGPSLLIGAGAAAGLGLSSDPAALGRLFATLAWSHFALELAGEVSLPSTTHRADGTGFSQEQFLAGLAGCGVRGAFSACAVGKAGELRVVGQGVDVPLTASGPMIQAGLRLAASHPFGHRTYITAHLEGLGRLTQGTVTLDSMPVWTTPRFAALFGIDIALRFK
jgi:hypothetical protein